MEIRKNEKLNGIEVIFATMPKIEVRETLKANGFRWSKTKKLWYAKYTEWRIKALSEMQEFKEARELESEPLFELGVKRTELGWEGVNFERKLEMSEINSLIKRECKRRFPSVKISTKKNRGGYLTSITTSVYTDEVCTLEEFKVKWKTIDNGFKFGYENDLDEDLDAYGRDNEGYIEKMYHSYVEEFKDGYAPFMCKPQIGEIVSFLKEAYDSFNYYETGVGYDFGDVSFYNDIRVVYKGEK